MSIDPWKEWEKRIAQIQAVHSAESKRIARNATIAIVLIASPSIVLGIVNIVALLLRHC